MYKHNATNFVYIPIYYHYNVFFLNLLLFAYLFINSFYYFNSTHKNVIRFHRVDKPFY